ncbi:MAG: hypothetical protein KF718_15460 [Polyangiaceae bacterium]|nr:hypothetical protein [Polyangiaceae bacterium]
MPTRKIQVKLYFVASERPPLERFVPVLHTILRDDALGELMIDVVDYGHVHHGPGVVLIGHATDYGIDLGEGRPGVLVFRKREPVTGDRIADALGRALRFAALLARVPELGSALRTDEVLIRLPDRLHAPSTDAGFERLTAELSALGQRLYDAPVALERASSPRQPLSVRWRAPSSPTVEELLARLP